MKKMYGKLVFSFVFIALMSSVVAPVNAVAPPVGVSDGVSFDFVVEKFTSTDTDDKGFLLGTNSGSVYATQGDEFTITFVDATPYDNLGKYYLDYEVSFEGQTFTRPQQIDIPIVSDNDEDEGEEDVLVVNTDWDTTIPALKSYFDEQKANFENYYESTPSVSVIETEGEVGFTFSVDFSLTIYAVEVSVKVDFEMRIERSTGVMLYLSGKESSTSTFEGETESESGEMAVKRVGYSVPGGSDDSGLPGFEFTAIFAAFSLMFVPIVLRRKKQNYY